MEAVKQAVLEAADPVGGEVVWADWHRGYALSISALAEGVEEAMVTDFHDALANTLRPAMAWADVVRFTTMLHDSDFVPALLTKADAHHFTYVPHDNPTAATWDATFVIGPDTEAIARRAEQERQAQVAKLLRSYYPALTDDHLRRIAEGMQSAEVEAKARQEKAPALSA